MHIASVYPDRLDVYVQAADFVARCIPLARADTKLDGAGRKKTEDSYAKQAIALLRTSVEKGLRNADRVRNTQSFKVLRDRPEYQKLLADIPTPQSK